MRHASLSLCSNYISAGVRGTAQVWYSRVLTDVTQSCGRVDTVTLVMIIKRLHVATDHENDWDTVLQCGS